MNERLRKSEEEWRRELTPEPYAVCRQEGTERAFTGRDWDCHEDGTDRCACCGAELFTSADKLESGSGWPSFVRPLAEGRIRTQTDGSHGRLRTEVLCARCDAHLGHVLPDGPRPTGPRYGIHSVSLDLAKKEGE